MKLHHLEKVFHQRQKNVIFDASRFLGAPLVVACGEKHEKEERVGGENGERDSMVAAVGKGERRVRVLWKRASTGMRERQPTR